MLADHVTLDLTALTIPNLRKYIYNVIDSIIANILPIYKRRESAQVSGNQSLLPITSELREGRGFPY